MSSPKKIVWPLVAAVAIAGGSYFGTSAFTHSQAAAETNTAETAKPTEKPHHEKVAPAQQLSEAFRNVHNAIKDAVVNISITKKEAAANFHQFQLPQGFRFPPGMLPPGMNPDDNGGQGDQGGGAEVIQGTGSGVVVSPDGYILTNNHVVEGATTINVRLGDDRSFPATVVGTDPKTDLAVIRIKADHLTYAKFGNSDDVQVGDIVLAFGSPLGLAQSMTQGIISAKGRQIGIIASHNPALQNLTYEDFLQTDAAINPGNSGGPLVDLNGDVIGINSAIASSTGNFAGVGFSIPSNEAKYIMEQLIKTGHVDRGFLNVRIEDINRPAPEDQQLADSIKKQGFKGEGALVGAVGPEGPAAKGGVQPGDVITRLNGKPVTSVNELRNKIARTAPGTEVALTVFRDGKNVDLKFPVGKQPATIAAATLGEGNVSPAMSSDLGVQTQKIDPETARRYHLNAGQGVIVTNVDTHGIAAQAGLEPGDVIMRVNQKPVNTPADLNDAVSKSSLAKGVRLTVRTQDGMERLVFVQKQ